MQKVISPNAYQFVLVKKSVTEGLGLAPWRGKHTEPHTNSEIWKLMQVYQTHQLHLFRSGRSYGSDVQKVDNLGCGQLKLIEGKLKHRFMKQHAGDCRMFCPQLWICSIIWKWTLTTWIRSY